MLDYRDTGGGVASGAALLLIGSSLLKSIKSIERTIYNLIPNPP